MISWLCDDLQECVNGNIIIIDVEEIVLDDYE